MPRVDHSMPFLVAAEYGCESVILLYSSTACPIASALARAYRIFPLSLPSAAQRASVMHRHWDVVKWMVSEAGVNVLTQDHRTGFGLLHAACKGGQAELLDQLLTWDLQIPTDRGLSPLYSSWHRSPDDASFAPCAF